MNKIVICGSGASVSEGIDKCVWSYLQGQCIWVINHMFLLLPYLPNAIIWQDRCFWDKNKPALLERQSAGVSLYSQECDCYNGYPVSQYRQSTTAFSGTCGIEDNIMFTGGAGLTGVFALSLAVAMGFDVIYLLGYDFGSPSLYGRTHCYTGLNPGAEGRNSIYRDSKGIRKEVHDFDRFVSNEYDIFTVGFSNIKSFPNIGYDLFMKSVVQ